MRTKEKQGPDGSQPKQEQPMAQGYGREMEAKAQRWQLATKIGTPTPNGASVATLVLEMG